MKGSNPRNGDSAASPSLTRRKLIASGALGTAALAAGCSSNESSDVQETVTDAENNLGGSTEEGTEQLPEDVRVEGQDLIIPMSDNPEQVHFAPFHSGATSGLESELEPANDVRLALFDTGMWGRVISSLYSPNPGELYPALFEEFSVEPKKITIQIQDDAHWSDGEPLTAFDVAGPFALWNPHIGSLGSDDPKAEARDPEEASLFPVQDVVMPDGRDGKVVEYHNWDWDEYPAWEEVGGFESRPYSTLYYHMAGPFRRRTALYPTHVEPWKTFVEDRWEWRQNHRLASDDPKPHPQTGSEYIADKLTVEDLERTREEGGLPTLGAWQIEEVRGAEEVVLKPNEHHYAAGEINFDRVRFEWNQEDRRARAGLHAGNLDYASVKSSPEEVQAYPDKYANLKSPLSQGHVLAIDHSTAFGDVRVRQAMMFALNTDQIAQNVHPDARRGIQIPGWDSWAADAVVDEEWAKNNLIDYTQDLNRAAELMREAGYELEDGVWTKDGEPLTTEIATPVSTPVWEETVAQQLNDFGIDISVRTFEGATFEERRWGSSANEIIEEEYGASGDFDLWNSGVGAGLAGYYTGLDYYWYGTLNNRSRVRALNIYDHDKVEEGMLLTDEEDYDGYGPSGWSWACAPGCQVDWTIDIPPIGDPDGSKEPFNPTATYNWTLFGGRDSDHPFDDNPYYNPPRDEPHPDNSEYYWKKYMWTVNWFLPALPFALAEQQHFLNAENWEWPADHDMWEYFGMGWDAKLLAGMGRVSADPNKPKEDAEVVEE